MTDERRFHIERLSMVLLAVGGVVLLSFGDLGSDCADVGGEVRCRVGDSIVTDRALLFGTFTPLIFGPVIYLLAAVTPRWEGPLGRGAQLAVVVTGLWIVAASFVMMSWGAGVGALVGFAVGGTGVYMAFRSWRLLQQ